MQLEQLSRLFVGKFVRVTHSGNKLGPIEGFCDQVIAGRDGAHDGEYAVVIQDQMMSFFVPENVTETYAEGPLPGEVGGRRKVEAIAIGQKNVKVEFDVRAMLRIEGTLGLTNRDTRYLKPGETYTLIGPIPIEYNHGVHRAFMVVGEQPERYVIESELTVPPGSE